MVFWEVGTSLKDLTNRGRQGQQSTSNVHFLLPFSSLLNNVVEVFSVESVQKRKD